MNIFTVLFVVFFVLPIFLAFYLLPTIIAWERQHRFLSVIVIINLAFGWTFFGWVVALAMAYADDQRGAPAKPTGGFCLICGKQQPEVNDENPHCLECEIAYGDEADFDNDYFDAKINA